MPKVLTGSDLAENGEVAYEPLEHRFLVLAPSTRDASIICQILSESGFEAGRCVDLEELLYEIRRGAICAVVLEEAISTRERRRRFTEVLIEQPNWSELPVLLLIGRRAETFGYHRILDDFLETAQVTLLERPLRVASLISAAQSAFRSRLRQYQRL